MTVPYILSQPEIIKQITPLAYDVQHDRFLFGDGPNRVELSTKDFKMQIDANNEASASSLYIPDLQVSYLQEINDLKLGILHGQRIFAGPRFFDFIETPKGSETLSRVPSSMLKVFNEAMPVSRQTDSSTIGNTPFSFYVNKLREGHLIVNAIGNCACLGVDGDGLLRESDWPTKFAEYSFHNIDFIAQRVSLISGLAFVAFCAEQSDLYIQRSIW